MSQGAEAEREAIVRMIERFADLCDREGADADGYFVERARIGAESARLLLGFIRRGDHLKFKPEGGT